MNIIYMISVYLPLLSDSDDLKSHHFALHQTHVKPIQLQMSNRFEINTLYISVINTKPAISLKHVKKDMTKLYIFYWIKDRR